MSGFARTLRVLAGHPIALAGTPFVAARALAKQLGRRRQFAGGEDGDPELALWELRGNWVLMALEAGQATISVERFKEAQDRASALPRDAYSASQRLANAVYLLRGLDPSQRTAAAIILSDGLISDAKCLASNFEFRTETVWFNNHLLNNYRAAVMAEAHRSLLPALPDLRPTIDAASGLLVRYRSTLFADGPVLLEGSVSYELLILKHLVDILCCGPADPFAGWVDDQKKRLKSVALVYRKENIWLLPQIGDCSPDWNLATMLSFLDGFILGHDTAYRRLWREQLRSAGL